MNPLQALKQLKKIMIKRKEHWLENTLILIVSKIESKKEKIIKGKLHELIKNTELIKLKPSTIIITSKLNEIELKALN